MWHVKCVFLCGCSASGLMRSLVGPDPTLDSDSLWNPGSTGGQEPCPLTNTPETTGNPQARALGLAGHVLVSSAAQSLLQLTLLDLWKGNYRPANWSTIRVVGRIKSTTVSWFLGLLWSLFICISSKLASKISFHPDFLLWVSFLSL